MLVQGRERGTTCDWSSFQRRGASGQAGGVDLFLLDFFGYPVRRTPPSEEASLSFPDRSPESGGNDEICLVHLQSGRCLLEGYVPGIRRLSLRVPFASRVAVSASCFLQKGAPQCAPRKEE